MIEVEKHDNGEYSFLIGTSYNSGDLDEFWVDFEQQEVTMPLAKDTAVTFGLQNRHDYDWYNIVFKIDNIITEYEGRCK